MFKSILVSSVLLFAQNSFAETLICNSHDYHRGVEKREVKLDASTPVASFSVGRSLVFASRDDSGEITLNLTAVEKVAHFGNSEAKDNIVTLKASELGSHPIADAYFNGAANEERYVEGSCVGGICFPSGIRLVSVATDTFLRCNIK